MSFDLNQLGAAFLDRGGKATMRRVSNGIRRLERPVDLVFCGECRRNKPKDLFDVDKRFKHSRPKGTCRACLAENRRKAAREWHNRNRVRMTAYMREWHRKNEFREVYQWREKNREHYNGYQRQYRRAHPVSKEAQARYRANRKVKNPDYNKQYYLKNREMMMAKQRERRQAKRVVATPLAA